MTLGASAWATWRNTRVKKWKTEHPWKFLHPTAAGGPWVKLKVQGYDCTDLQKWGVGDDDLGS